MVLFITVLPLGIMEPWIACNVCHQSSSSLNVITVIRMLPHDKIQHCIACIVHHLCSSCVNVVTVIRIIPHDKIKPCIAYNVTFVQLLECYHVVKWNLE